MVHESMKYECVHSEEKEHCLNLVSNTYAKILEIRDV